MSNPTSSRACSWGISGRHHPGPCKSETRNPKSETIGNFQLEMLKMASGQRFWTFLSSHFGFVSDFGFRLSDFPRRLLLVLPRVALFALCLSAGCVSHIPRRGAARPSAAPQTTPAPTTNAPAVPNAPGSTAAESDVLKQVAAKPPKPFEGEGWQPMFDGRTLKGGP